MRFDEIKWETDPGKRLRQIILLPVVLFIVLLSALLTPPMYFMHLWDRYRAWHELKRMIALDPSSAADAESPAEKSIADLWSLHGLNESGSSIDERLELLSKWVAILYGERTATELDIKQRHAAIAERQFKANRSWYEGKEDAFHFMFSPPMRVLIEQLSQELPSYDTTTLYSRR